MHMAAEFGRHLPSPSKWLINPEKKKRVLFFIRDPQSLMRMPQLTSQHWYSTDEGILTRIKNTRTMELENAVLIWNKFLNN